MESPHRREADKGFAPVQVQDEAAATNPPHFFKVILSLQPKLMLPKKFVKEYGHNLPGTVLLEAPKGPIWQTRLTRSSDDEVWLDEGFQQFKEYYSIRFGYLLVFRYDDENLSFRVLIFNASGVEIEYSSRGADKLNTSSVLQVESGDDSSKQIIKEVGTSSGQHLEPPVPVSPRIRKKAFLSYQKARAFKSVNPYFIAFIQRSYVSGVYVLCFSLNFAKKYLHKLKDDEVMLCIPDGRKWNVGFYMSTSSARLRWKTFVLDNGLQVGDACVFEWKTEREPYFKVTIFRN